MDLTEAYLDLLKRVLTRSGLGPVFSPYAPPSTARLKAPVVNRVQSLLGRRDLQLAKRIADPESATADGLIHPLAGETMIGRRRLDNVHDCIRRIVADNVPGDLIEAGVWRGGTSIFMRAALMAYNDVNRTVWVADSFAGLPPPDPKYPADAGDDHWAQPELAVSLEEVKDNFARYGFLDDRVQFLKGWFKDTLPTAPIKKLAILRLDGDMYESTMQTLDALYQKVVSGGFVIVDDYALPHCREAVQHYRDREGVTEPLLEVEEPSSARGRSAAYWRRS